MKNHPVNKAVSLLNKALMLKGGATLKTLRRVNLFMAAKNLLLLLILLNTFSPHLGFAQCTLRAFAGPDQMICLGTSATLNGTHSGGTPPYSFLWSNGSNTASISVSPAGNTTYALTVTDGSGSCVATDQAIVYVKPLINRIYNGDFENGSTPTGRFQLTNATGWQNATGNPDLFDVNTLSCAGGICGNSPADFNCVGIPCNHVGNRPALGVVPPLDTTGNRYAGLFAATQLSYYTAASTTPTNYFDYKIESFVEGIEKQITTLQGGVNYNISFWVSRAQKGDLGRNIVLPTGKRLFVHNDTIHTYGGTYIDSTTTLVGECANFKVKFSNGFASDPAYGPVNAFEVYASTVCDTSNWVLVTCSFRPPVGTHYDHIIIESAAYQTLAAAYLAQFAHVPPPPTPINETSKTAVYSTVFESYFYIDDIDITEQCSYVYPTVDPGPNKDICKGNSTSIGGTPTATGGTSPYTYNWSPPSGVVYPNNANPTVSPINTTTYTVKVTDAWGYSSSKHMVVSVGDLSNFNVGPNVSICNGSSYTINYNPPHDDNTPLVYNWSPAAGLSSSIAANPVASPSVTTTYKVTVTDQGSCSATSSIVITINSTPQASITPTANPLCNGDGVNLKGVVTGTYSGQVLQYEWIANGNIFAYTQSVNVNPTTTTVYQFKVIESLNGCYTIANYTVNVPTPLVANAGGDQYICPGGSTTITGSASGGTRGLSPPYFYSWSNGSIVVSTNASYTTSIPGGYTLTVIDGNGCTASNSMVLHNYIPPVANAGGNKNICLGHGEALGATHTASAGTAGYTYQWSPSTYLDNTTAAHPISTPTAVGTITYTVTVTDQNGCTATDKAVYTTTVCTGTCLVCADITANAGNDRTLCAGSSTTLGGSPTASGGGTGSYTYSWSPSAGLNNTAVANPVCSGLTNETTYTLIVSFTCTGGCTSVISKDVVTVIPSNNLNIVAGPNQAICPGSSVYIGHQATAGLPPYSYSWNPPAGSGPRISVSPSTTTKYYEQVTDFAGCIARDSVVVSVDQVLVYNPPYNVNICKGSGGTTIGATASGGTPPYTYQWAPIWGLSSTSATPFVNPTITSTYPVTVTDAVGCQVARQIVVHVNPLPYVFAGDNQTLCYRDSIVIGNSATAGTPGYSYSWTPTSGLSNAGSATPKTSPSVTTTYTVVVTDINGCTGSSNLVITIIPSPTANAGPPRAICSGNCVTIGNASTTGVGPFSYSWTPATGLSNPNIATPTACPNVNTTYHFTVTGANLCSKKDSVVIQVFNSPQYICNGTFEDGVTPDYRGDIEDATCWQKATGSPDLFDANFSYINNCLPLLGNNVPNIINCGNAVVDINCIGVPCNHFGYQDNHTSPYGTRYTGLYAAVGPISLIKQDFGINDPIYASTGIQKVSSKTLIVEGMKTHLLKPLIKGRKYELSFWMARAPKGEIDSFNVAKKSMYKIKMSLGNKPDSNTFYRPVNLPVKFKGSVDTLSTWVQKVHYFTADSAYSTLIIESDLDTLLSANTNLNGPSANVNLTRAYQSYFYIDDVSLVEACDTIPPLIANAGNDTTMCRGKQKRIGGSPTAAFGVPAPHYSYSWTANPLTGGFITSTTIANPTVAPTTTTTYTVVVTDGAATTASSRCIVNIFVQQEYINNGTFEFGTVPVLRGDIEKAPTWRKATGDADLYDSLFTNCPNPLCGNSPADYNCIGLPCNHFGYQHHRTVSGHRYAGMWSLVQLGSTVVASGGGGGVSTGGSPDGGGLPGLTAQINDRQKVPGQKVTLTYQIAVEGIEIQFPQALDTNRTYHLGFYVSRAEKGETGRNIPLPTVSTHIDSQNLLVDSCAGFDVKFSTNFAQNILYQPVNRPVKMSGIVCDTNNWVYVAYTFKPDSAYNYIIIESYPTNGIKHVFSSSPINTYVNGGGISTGNPTLNNDYHAAGFQSYFYIDDVSMTEICDPAPISSARFGHGSVTARSGSSHKENVPIPVVKGDGSVQIYPNPNSGQFTLVYNAAESLTQPLQVVIYNLMGAVVKTMSVNTQEGPNRLNIDMSSNSNGGLLSDGIYLIRVMDGKQETIKKISITGLSKYNY